MPEILFDGVTETTEDVRQLATQSSVIRTLSNTLVYICRHALAIDDVYRNAFLIRASGRDDAKRTRVDLLVPIAGEEDHHLLPTILTPRLAAIPLAEISSILHNAIHRPRKHAATLVVDGHDDKQLCSTRGAIMHPTEGEAVIFKAARVTSRGRIAHVSELAFHLYGHRRRRG